MFELPQTQTLSNGLKILYIHNPSAISVYINFIGKVGRRAEQGEEIGAAHFLEHLFFDGTERFPSAYHLAQHIDSYGGLRGGTTNSELVNYWCKILPEHTEVAFDYIADIVMHSKLKEIEKERKVIKQEALMNRDKIDMFLGRTHKSSLFPDQTIGQTIFEEEGNLDNLTPDILRSYMKRVYSTGNFVLVVIGPDSLEKYLKLAEQYFSAFPQGESLAFPPARMRSDKMVQILPRDLKQSHFVLSYRGYAAGTDSELIAQIVCTLFGNSTSARLGNRLRNELHLVYSIGAQHIEFADAGFISIRTSLEEGNLQPALTAIKEEIEHLLRDGVTDQELNKAKTLFLSRMLFRLEHPENLSLHYGYQALLQPSARSIDGMRQFIHQITPNWFLAVAQEIFSSPPQLTIVTQNNVPITY